MMNNRLHTLHRRLRALAAVALLAWLAPPEALAQVSAGNEGLSIRPTDWFSSEGLAFQPAAGHPVPVVQNRLSRSATAVAIGPGSSLPQVYRFAEPVSFSGTIRIRYHQADATGHEETNLWVFVQPATNAPFRPIASVRDSDERFVQATLGSQSLLALTLADPTMVGYVLTPQTPDVSAITQQGFTLEWPPVAGAVDYRIEVATTPDFTTWAPGMDPLVVGEQTSVTLNGLEAGTPYYFRLVAVDAAGGTQVSPAGTAQTEYWKLERIDPFESITVDYGTPLANLSLPETATVFLENGDEQQWAVNWDGSAPAYNATVPATYSFSGSVVPTDGTSNPDHIKATIAVTVEKGSLTGVTLTPVEVTYDGRPHALTVQNLPTAATVQYTIQREGDEPKAGNAATDAGTYTVAARVQLEGFDELPLSAQLVITPAVRTLDFPVMGEKVYGDDEFNAGATSSSGEAVVYTSDNASVAEVTDSGLIRVTGAGTATITAAVAADANYADRPTISRVLTVQKAGQVIRFNAPAEVNRDAGSLQLDVSANSGLPVTLSLDDEQVATLSGATFNILRLGTVTITATQAGDANYEAAEPVTVTVRVVDPSSDFPVRVHPAVSRNADGINEFLMIEGIRDYPENRVSIFNRNGTVVWEASGYDNDRVAFRGVGTGQMLLPAGTYFYIVEIKDGGTWKYRKGYFVLRY
ncbi:hypothetical protein GCM10007415_39460 [Parapedobacter pyrenivorans]|uniref:Fibronectin type-III domain-containing protein n=1 Tax=Parapedobacter pyrenivorans TaxID=1305674 RepID=A0A917HZI8_9SPHI|nr:gliding motility-associated C-terminal domain-containing protein [Parapedobacter pyrenivorans]GGG99717.1 hypothetical protein GCM10007415_39460 [Parapedobacter pyrenivorans]